MRFEIVVIIISLLIMANIYTDGKYLKLALTWKKYYQMAGVAIGGYMLCWLLRKDPERAKDMIMTSNEYLKHLPIDKDTSSILHPILDMTKQQRFSDHPNSITNPKSAHYQQKVMTSGGERTTKRSVSETKKKFVAARQNWHCGDCQKQLPAWFEVDHTIRLDRGGSNHVDNLVALCRDCHGKKTAIENL